MTTDIRITLAVQKSGRLSEDSLRLLRECGFEFNGGLASSRLRASSSNFPLDLLFLRDDDIPRYLADGVVDVGIVGQNTLVESNGTASECVEVVEELGFARCRLAIAVPRGVEYKSLEDLRGKRIATSHPHILRAYLERLKIDAHIHEISGSVEIAPSLGLAEAICDLVSSGSTLVSNGLKEVERVFDSQAVLAANSSLNEGQRELLDKMLFRVRAVQRARNNKYVLLNAPNEALDRIISTLPGIKSPTVVPLAKAGWSSVHSVMNEDEFWEKIELLREAGAEGILIVPIEKMIV
ncbi:MAG: ATP phosphoribosyltransferase [Deltaproteobacteria bacterium]|nr:ATP phosphoribosyltransferase [Deltaproteobacteria bacterium]